MQTTINTAILVSGGGTNLQAIIDASGRGELPHVKLSLVLSSKAGAYALERAAAAGIPGFAVSKKALGSQAAFEEALLKKLKEYNIKVIVLAGFLSILSEDFVKCYENRILNVHPSLIPAFCGDGFYGLKVHEAALARGVKLTGATVHLVNAETDGGPILAQKAVRVYPGDTPERLQKRVMRQAEWKLLPAALEQVANALIQE